MSRVPSSSSLLSQILGDRERQRAKQQEWMQLTNGTGNFIEFGVNHPQRDGQGAINNDLKRAFFEEGRRPSISHMSGFQSEVAAPGMTAAGTPSPFDRIAPQFAAQERAGRFNNVARGLAAAAKDFSAGGAGGGPKEIAARAEKLARQASGPQEIRNVFAELPASAANDNRMALLMQLLGQRYA